MKSWTEAARDSIGPGLISGAAVSAAAAWRGQADTGSAVAPLNATSHVIWGGRAAQVERATLRHTGVGVAVSVLSAVFWAAVFEKLFGRAIERRGAPAALLGGAAVAGLAYVTDYGVVPRRLTPGFERRVARSSMPYIFGALALGLAGGALLRRQRRH